MLIEILLVTALGLGLLGAASKQNQKNRLHPIKIRVRPERRQK